MWFRSRQNTIPDEAIHEIPTKPSVFKARVVSVAAIMLAGLAAAVWFLCPSGFDAFLVRNSEAMAVLQAHGLVTVVHACLSMMAALGMFCAFSGLLSLLRNRFTYRILRTSLMMVYPLLTVWLVVVWKSVFSFLDVNELAIDGNIQDRATVLKLWWSICWPVLATMLYVVWLHMLMWSRSVYAAFTGEKGEPLSGDAVLEDIRTHGRDPDARRNFYRSALTHLLIIIVIPWMLQLGGCVTPYRVPKGSGNPVVAMVKMVKPKKTKEKKMTLRPDSAIVFEIPDLDETEVDQVMEEKSQVTYQALANAKAGKMGKGGGTEGGWPEGMEDYKIRFIRLEHGGVGWDDGMGDSGADINFLKAFAKHTGFDKIASRGESHSIRLLTKYPKDAFPPFVFLTGNGTLGRISTGEQKILREYLLGGGMLIADSGSIEFHRSFMRFISQVFPDKRVVDVPDDDMIYQLPYGFPNGAPSFWHHGGRRGLGVKHDGRWVVFYHPGDMNDAWKSRAYTDVTPEMRDAAIQLGVNLVYYAFNNWDDAVSKVRK